MTDLFRYEWIYSTDLSVPAPYGGKQKCYFFKMALSFKPPLGIFSHSAIALISLTVSKKISQVNVVYHCGNSDNVAPPPCPPQAFREKGLTQTLYLVLICAVFFVCHTTKKAAASCATAFSLYSRFICSSFYAVTFISSLASKRGTL